MEIRKTKTKRGFDLIEFEDSYGIKCNIQKSSTIDDAVWLGVEDADPQIMAAGTGWVKYVMPDDVLLTTRMHLTREQVHTLLPILQKFAETGEI